MQIKFFVISDDADFRTQLKEYLQLKWQASVVEHDPQVNGWPGEDVVLSDYRVLFLDYNIENNNGLDWFRVLQGQQTLPPTIILTAKAYPEIAVECIKSGAENYLAKSSIARSKLEPVVSQVLRETQVLPTAVEAAAGLSTGASRVIRLPAKRNVREALPQIEGYSILKQIGRGGMSAIFLATREHDNQKLVIKTLSAALVDNKKSVTRSNQEFSLISRIKHPHIVRLYEHGTIGNVIYTVMEYFAKGDLKQRLRDGITQKQALSYLRQIAEGLNATHRCGIIHRDLKPGNIMFREDNSLAIIDFGISKDLNSQLDLTTSGQIMGTPNYMAPEQASGMQKTDARSDIYSLGVMLYEMLMGKKPFVAATGAAIIYKHVYDPIPRLPNRFYELQVLVDKMMAKLPQQRFQSAFDLLQFLDNQLRLDVMLDFS